MQNKKTMEHNCKSTYFIGLVIGTMLVTGTALQAPVDFAIIDAHEHIESIQKAESLLAANEIAGIGKTVLLASPSETLTLNGRQSFTGYRENFDEIMRIVDQYPKNFIPFCTVNPLDTDALDYVRDCHAKGAVGLKLYNGHSYYYNIFNMPLDAPQMEPIYAYAEANKMPIIYHINITTYGDELSRVLSAHPNLVVSVPHFMVSSINLDLVEQMLDRFPNLYTDVSFGSPEFLAAGLRRISHNPSKYAAFVNKYFERILFGADMVVTDAEYKDQAFMEYSLQCYRDMLEQRRFQCSPAYSYYKAVLDGHKQRYDICQPIDSDYCVSVKQLVDLYEDRLAEVENLNGMNLSSSVLRNIYEKNALKFLGLPMPTQDETGGTSETPAE